MKTKESKQKPQVLCSQFGAVKPHMGMICFWAAKKPPQETKFMMCEVMYMDNTPFPQLLKITPMLPM